MKKMEELSKTPGKQLVNSKGYQRLSRGASIPTAKLSKTAYNGKDK
jgi:hypothetical protein